MKDIIDERGDEGHGEKLAWFVGLWLAGVIAVFLLAFVIRSAIL